MDNQFNDQSSHVSDRKEDHFNQRVNIWKFLLPVIVILAVLIPLIWGNAQRAKAQQYEQHLQSLYDKSYNVINDDLNKIETTLSKTMVVSSEKQYTVLLNDIWKTSSKAVGELGQLPASFVDFSPLNRFLVQLGDYSHSLTKKIADGGTIEPKDTEQLLQMYNVCVDINRQLAGAQQSGNASFSAIALSSGQYLESTQDASISFKEEGEESLYPSLIYDGPFSESTKQAEPRGLTSESFTQEMALQRAKDFLGVDLVGEPQATNDVDSHLPAYGFEATLNNDRTVSLNITKQGGQLLWMMSSHSAEQQSADLPSPERGTELGEVGRNYLKTIGFDSMEPTYAQYYDGAGVINYAHVQDGVILYADLVRVWVEIDTARVIGVDSRNYLYSHTKRTIPEEKLTPEEAQAFVSPALQIESVKRALIPLTISDERFCYEFKGSFGGDQFIVYINAETGAEEQIFKIINTGDGQLVL